MEWTGLTEPTSKACKNLTEGEAIRCALEWPPSRKQGESSRRALLGLEFLSFWYAGDRVKSVDVAAAQTRDEVATRAESLSVALAGMFPVGSACEWSRSRQNARALHATIAPVQPWGGDQARPHTWSMQLTAHWGSSFAGSAGIGGNLRRVWAMAETGHIVETAARRRCNSPRNDMCYPRSMEPPAHQMAELR